MDKLTPKQSRFVSEYLIDLNATQAAIRAGYSKHTASQIGEQNLRKLGIAQAITAALAKRTKRTEIDQDYVLAAIRQTMERCSQGEPVMRDGEETGRWTFNANAVLKGAELLGRHLAMFTDKAVVDLNHGVQDPAEIIARATQAAERLGIILPLHMLGRPRKEKGDKSR